MSGDGILAGYDLGEVNANLANCMLTNVTETKREDDIVKFVESLRTAVGAA
jgi:hypothetical protein